VFEWVFDCDLSYDVAGCRLQVAGCRLLIAYVAATILDGGGVRDVQFPTEFSLSAGDAVRRFCGSDAGSGRARPHFPLTLPLPFHATS